MKILQVGKYYPPYKGGIENNTRHCAEELAKDHEVVVLVFNTGKQTIDEMVGNIRVIRVGSMGNIFSQELSFKMNKYIKEVNADVIHFHAPNPIAMVAIMMAAPKTPLVVTHHTDIVRQKVIRNFVLPLYKKMLSKSRYIISYTNTYAEYSKELKGFEDKFVIIPNGTIEKPFQDEALIEAKAVEFREKYTKGAPTVSFLGRIVGYKGVDLIIKTLKEQPHIHALIGGKGPALEANKQLARQFGMTDRIHFVGEVNDENKGGFFKASDIFLLPCKNRTESYGQVLVEAQLCKLPTIVADVHSGVSEVTKHNVTGMVIKPNSVYELAGAIAQILGSEPLRTRMGEAGYERAKTHYVETVTGPKLRELFNTFKK